MRRDHQRGTAHGSDRIHRRIGIDGPRHGEEPARQGPRGLAHGASQPRARRRPARRRRARGGHAGRARRDERDRLPLRHRIAAGRVVARRRCRACSPARGRGLVIVDCSTSEPDFDDAPARDLRRRRRACSSMRRWRARRSRPRPASSTSWSAPTTRPSPGSSRSCAPSPRTSSTSAVPAPATSSSCSTTSSPRRSAPRPPRRSRSASAPASIPKKLVDLVSMGAVNSGIFQMMAKTLDGDLGALKFELDNAQEGHPLLHPPRRRPRDPDCRRRGGAPVARPRERARLTARSSSRPWSKPRSS